jgi:phosphatidylserine/phosphatidylglycerophosphate/cardiolipin synthase-like enzyme
MTRNPRIGALLILLLTLGAIAAFLAAALTPGRLDSAPRLAAVPQPAPSAASPLRAYFSDRTLELGGGPDQYLVAAIDAARLSVDIAAYEIDLWSVRDALLAAHRRGVQVRLVAEADNADSPAMQALVEAGIPLVADGSEGLMHNKFVIIDRQEVWTGSLNYTVNAAYHNDENLIALASPEAAAAYRAEFEEMYGGKFGAFSPRGEASRLLVGASPVEVWFSPDDGVSARVEELLAGAQSSIHFMAFSFTSDPLAEAMLARAADGLVVQGVFDKSQYNSNGSASEFDRLLAGGLAVRLDGNPDKLHHKVIIIDGWIVVAGSYNFSASAEERNDENVVIIFDEGIARLFLEEWRRVWEAAE